MKDIPKDVLEYFYYDENSPSGLRWAVTVHGNNNAIKACIGDIAGSKTRGYYEVSVRVDGKKHRFAVHRVVYSLHFKLSKRDFIDHIDGDRSNNKISNLRVVSRSLNNRNVSKRNREYPTGVDLVSSSRGSNIYFSYRASWVELDGTRKSKQFSVNKFGDDTAFKLAVDYRNKMIYNLNQNGAGYTDRHGT